MSRGTTDGGTVLRNCNRAIVANLLTEFNGYDSARRERVRQSVLFDSPAHGRFQPAALSHIDAAKNDAFKVEHINHKRRRFAQASAGSSKKVYCVGIAPVGCCAHISSRNFSTVVASEPRGMPALLKPVLRPAPTLQNPSKDPRFP